MRVDKLVPHIRFKGFEEKWSRKRIKDIVSIQAGGDLDKNKLEKNGKYPVIGNTQKNNGILGYLNTYKINAPAVTVTGRGEIGHASFQSIPFTPVVRILALSNKNEKLNMRFLSLAIDNINFFIESTGVPQLTAPQLGVFKVRLPRVEEQKKIGDLFAKLDRLLDLQQQKLDQLELLKKALLQKLFPKKDAKIPELRFKGFVGKWKTKQMDTFVNRLDNQRAPVTASKRIPGITPYYGANGIQDFVKGYTHQGEFVLIAEDGANDLHDYPVKYVSGKIWVNNHAHVIQAKPDLADNVFVSYAFKNKKIEPYLVGGGRAKLNAEVLMKMNLKLPTLPEQQKIGNLFAKIDRLIELQNKKFDNLKQVKKSLLQNMFVE